MRDLGRNPTGWSHRWCGRQMAMWIGEGSEPRARLVALREGYGSEAWGHRRNERTCGRGEGGPGPSRDPGLGQSRGQEREPQGRYWKLSFEPVHRLSGAIGTLGASAILWLPTTTQRVAPPCQCRELGSWPRLACAHYRQARAPRFRLSRWRWGLQSPWRARDAHSDSHRRSASHRA